MWHVLEGPPNREGGGGVHGSRTQVGSPVAEGPGQRAGNRNIQGVATDQAKLTAPKPVPRLGDRTARGRHDRVVDRIQVYYLTKWLISPVYLLNALAELALPPWGLRSDSRGTQTAEVKV